MTGLLLMMLFYFNQSYLAWSSISSLMLVIFGIREIIKPGIRIAQAQQKIYEYVDIETKLLSTGPSENLFYELRKLQTKPENYSLVSLENIAVNRTIKMYGLSTDSIQPYSFLSWILNKLI
jgi:hypothetical protein